MRPSLPVSLSSLLAAAAILSSPVISPRALAGTYTVTSSTPITISNVPPGDFGNPFPSTTGVLLNDIAARGVIKSARLVLTGVTDGYPARLSVNLLHSTLAAGAPPDNAAFAQGLPVHTGGYYVYGNSLVPAYDITFTDTGMVWNPYVVLVPRVPMKSEAGLDAYFSGKPVAGYYSLYVSAADFSPGVAVATIGGFKVILTTVSDLYFDPAGAVAGTGGTGVWADTLAGGTAGWREEGDSNGNPARVWDNTLNFTAHFGGVAGTVNVDATGVSAYSLAFDTNGYTLSGGAVALTDGEVNVGAGIATLATLLDTADNGFLKTGDGELDVGAGGVISGGAIKVRQGLLALGNGGVVTTADSVNILSGVFNQIGGTLTTPALNVSGGVYNYGGGAISAGTVLTVSGTGTVTTANVTPVFADLTVSDSATVTATAGLQVTGTATIRDKAGVTVTGGAFAADTLRFEGGSLRADQFAVTTANFTGGGYSPAGVGTIGAANFTGTLNLGGDIAYLVDVTSSTVHDTTSAAQTNMTGGTLVVNLLPGSNVQLGQSFTLFTGPVSGRFEHVRTANAYPFLSLLQIPDSGDFVANADFAGAASRVGGGSTTAAVGAALQRVYDGGGPAQAGLAQLATDAATVHDASVVLAAFVPNNGLALTNTGRNAATSMAASYSSFISRIRSGGFNTSDFSSTPLFNSYSFDYSGKPPVLLASSDDAALPLFSSDCEDFSVWINGNAGLRRTKNDPAANLVESRDNYYGGAVGLDYRMTSRLEDDVHVGLFVAAQGGESENGGAGSSGSSDTTSYAPGLYVSGVAGDFELDLMGSYALSDYKISRDIPALGLTPASTAEADTDGSQAMVRGGVARPWRFKNGTFFTPAASLTYTHVEVGGYTETGTGLALLTVGDQRFDSLESNFGFTLGRQIDFDALSIAPSFSLGWGHEFLDKSGQVGVSSNTLGGAFSYTADTPELGADFVTVGVNLAFYTSAHTRFMIGYDGRFLREGVTADHRASATFRIDF